MSDPNILGAVLCCQAEAHGYILVSMWNMISSFSEAFSEVFTKHGKEAIKRVTAAFRALVITTVPSHHRPQTSSINPRITR